MFGSARARALSAVDQRYHRDGLIVADVSNDPTYAEVLVETFGQRVIGVHISRFGDGMARDNWQCRHGYLPVYTIGRSYLLELLHTEFQDDTVRIVNSPTTRLAYEQLANLDVEYREGGTVYGCPSGQHDDLAISLAMLAWAAQHPHLEHWIRNLQMARRPRRPREKFNWAAVT